ncbi:MAG: hypothetical protein MUF23_02665 [Pirellula sp.]|jgi:hypothetical protein|nr:hypothetical protein [Pirellula sp.]
MLVMHPVAPALLQIAAALKPLQAVAAIRAVVASWHVTVLARLLVALAMQLPPAVLQLQLQLADAIQLLQLAAVKPPLLAVAELQLQHVAVAKAL